MDANVFGVVRVTQVFLPCMVAAGTGTSSTSSAGKWASMYQSPYNASKHALIGLTRCVALEIAKTGVVVTAVCPGFVDTPLLLESDLLRRLGHEAPRPPGDGGVARSDRPAHRSRGSGGAGAVPLRPPRWRRHRPVVLDQRRASLHLMPVAGPRLPSPGREESGSAAPAVTASPPPIPVASVCPAATAATTGRPIGGNSRTGGPSVEHLRS